jgi:TonB family protein
VSAADDPKPHGLGLLAARVSDDAAVERLRAGLRDPHPETRAAAVRVINVSGTGVLVPEVQDALAKESDPGAASEMIRFLAVLVRPELDADVLAAGRRLGAPVHRALADGLARRGAAAYVHLPALVALGLNEGAQETFHRLATATGAFGPASAPILRERAARPWSSLLTSAREGRVPVETGLLVAALRSDSPAMRAVTCWHVALETRSGPPSSQLMDVFPEPAPTDPDGSRDPEERRACEYARRALGRPARAGFVDPPAQPTALSALAPSDRDFDARVYELATAAEREAMRAIAGHSERFERLVARGRPLVTQARTVSELPAGFVADALAATGCKLGETALVRGGRVSYAADGRPRSVPGFPGAKKCDEAARVLVASSLAPQGVPVRPDEALTLLVPDRRSILLAPAPEPTLDGSSEPMAVGATRTLREPRKIVNVNPEFPRSAREAGRGGQVVLEAVIARTGEITQVRVLESAGQDFDLSAVGAVGGWRYTPVLLDGRAVPVIMTVTVNFKLSGTAPIGLDPLERP